MDAGIISIGSTILRKPIEDLYSAATGAVRRRLNKLRATERIRELSRHAARAQKVKTLWTRDKAVNLQSFYYPSRIIFQGGIRKIDYIDEISAEESFVIQGTVGQGKSIFLRYLYIKELVRELRLPVFIELRKYDASGSLEEFVRREIGMFGIPNDQEIFEYLVNSGKLVLILDGFDEIEPSHVQKAVNELEVLVGRFSNLQVVISARPDCGIQQSAHFPVFHLAPLSPADHQPFLEKIGLEKKAATKIVSSISQSQLQVQELLQTPLLLTLLVIVHNVTQEIPPTVSAFFEELFLTLLTRHDRTKAGFKRARACKLGDHELKRAFEAFCYTARQGGFLFLSQSKMAQVLEESKKLSALSFNVDDFCDDITKVACLMQLEGFNYQFIHKSVAEFHAARYIAGSTDEVAKKFYAGVRQIPIFKWREELQFLEEIDRYRYLKYFLIPSMEAALSTFIEDANVSVGQLTFSLETVLQWSQNVRVFYSNPVRNSTRPELPGLSMTSPGALSGIAEQRLRMQFAHIVMAVLSKVGASSMPQIDPNGTPLAEVLTASGVIESVVERMRGTIEDFRATLQKFKKEIQEKDTIASFINP